MPPASYFLVMAKIKTNPVSVRIFTRDFVVEGNAHTKAGGYQDRISDLLNFGKVSFLPVTDAKYRLRESETTEYIRSSCLVIRVDKIELLDILEEIS